MASSTLARACLNSCQLSQTSRIRSLHVSSRLSSSLASPTGSSRAAHSTLAVVGGGIGGLTSAFYFIRALPPNQRKTFRVVILERLDRLGGWIRSVNVPINNRPSAHTGTHNLVFETGPRSIRPAKLPGWTTIRLAQSLGLSSSIITVPRSSPAAKNRYLYLNNSLVQLPSSPLSLFTSPLILSLIPRILFEPFIPRHPSHRQPSGGDESVDSFFRRRFGNRVADLLVSSMINGIYGGDSRNLSVRAVFPALWQAEKRMASVILAFLFGKLRADRSQFTEKVKEDERECERLKGQVESLDPELVQRMSNASVWGFNGGLQTLTDTLYNYLRAEGVEVLMGNQGKVESVDLTDHGWILRTPTEEIHAKYVITSNPSILPPGLRPPPIPSVDIAVVNFAFESSPALPCPAGFGYLIPRSSDTTPLSQPNIHGDVLGVLFDSDVMPDVDGSSKAGLKKLSVLIRVRGRSNSNEPSPVPSSDYDEKEVKTTLKTWALDALKRHFKEVDDDNRTRTRFRSEPVHSIVSIHKNCIPQVPPGHPSVFKSLHEKVMDWNTTTDRPKIIFVGGGTGLVGVNGAVLAGRKAGEGMVRWAQDQVGTSGLEMWDY